MSTNFQVLQIQQQLSDARGAELNALVGYNKAIAASPVHALPGYIMGGISWFAIPWLCATTMGLAALALEGNPAFPTFPLRMPDADVSAGLVLPYAAVALLGSGGAVCTLLIVFMAVTSASSAELIAVSSIFTYDIYQTYFNPGASGKKLIYMSHAMVVGFGLFMASFSVGCEYLLPVLANAYLTWWTVFYAGISMGYLYVMMGVIISSAVIPATLTIMWAGHNKWAAALTPPLGLACAVITWLVTAKKTCGALDVACTGSNNPMLAGNVMALLSPLIFTPIFTLIFGVDKVSPIGPTSSLKISHAASVPRFPRRFENVGQTSNVQTKCALKRRAVTRLMPTSRLVGSHGNSRMTGKPEVASAMGRSRA